MVKEFPTFPDFVRDYEKRYLKALMNEAKGNKSLASRIGLMNRNTLRAKLRRYGLD